MVLEARLRSSMSWAFISEFGVDGKRGFPFGTMIGFGAPEVRPVVR